MFLIHGQLWKTITDTQFKPISKKKGIKLLLQLFKYSVAMDYSYKTAIIAIIAVKTRWTSETVNEIHLYIY